ncbi:MAG: oligosaccharide flippase family protein [Planctomycetota bacterium]|nr:oligosaccharide flippase family protein [Planctomycetota bacterium]
MTSLGRDTARGALWSLGGTAASQLVRLLVLVIVARCLTPAEVAVGGMALAAMGLFHVLTAAGFAQALVRQPSLTTSLTNTAFLSTLVPALLTVPIILLCAPFASSYFGSSDVTPLLGLLSVGLVFSATGSVPGSLLQREMRFREITRIRVVSESAAGAAAIALALGGAGSYAMVVPPVILAGVGASLSMIQSGFRPRLLWSWKAFREMRLFGLSQMGASLLRYVSDNCDYLIMSRYWSKTALGYYYFSFERSKAPFVLVYRRISEALFPAFSRIQGDKERLRRGYTNATVEFATVMFPAYVLVIGLADPVVPWVFGTQWRPAILVFQVFAAVSFLRTSLVAMPALLNALNLAHWDLAINAGRIALTLPSMILLGHLGAGIETTAFVMLGIWIAMTPWIVLLIARRLELRASALLRRGARVILGSACMACVLFASRSALESLSAPVGVEIVFASVAAAFVYAIVAREDLETLWRRMRGAVGSQGVG